MENLVSLEDELCNIENYYIIQQYRFGERVNLKIDINREDEEKILKYKIPKLTLQPIVENAIYHGIEKKITNGNIIIKIEATKNRMIITISDDGSGIEEDLLKKLNKKLNIISFDNININNRKKGGIALVNVNRRIKLLFGEEYGILIYSRVNAGTDVEITLPLIEGF
ncbi:Sensor histidine kinase YpdA [bioreactor metagenome]|uniref:Sensor histidine kinase YpdA n=1 Tax=bioreactor metagenome TaxID=1076179 RepID=A0A644XZP0_9ZZZZ